MQITKLYTVFEILDDEAKALQSFGQIRDGGRMTSVSRSPFDACPPGVRRAIR